MSSTTVRASQAPLLDEPAVLRRYGLNHRQLKAAIKAGRFPQPDVTFSTQQKRWRLETLERFELEGMSHAV